MKNRRHRIIKVTFGDKTVRYEIQKKTWFGKWINMMELYDPVADISFPVTYKTFEEAEGAYYRSFVCPMVEVVKEYE